VMQLVLYDVRADSSTYGQVIRLTLSDHDRRLVTIPTHVWHADQNVGTEEVFLINMPTRIYDYGNPDKMRLPIDTDLIPHDFGPSARGW
jgi:dTDP-4-dehydrorhamnose 3,5-epimerase